MLQCVAAGCSVLQRVAVCCSVLQCVAVCCSVLQCVAACCSVLQCVAVYYRTWQCLTESRHRHVTGQLPEAATRKVLTVKGQNLKNYDLTGVLTKVVCRFRLITGVYECARADEWLGVCICVCVRVRVCACRCVCVCVCL